MGGVPAAPSPRPRRPRHCRRRLRHAVFVVAADSGRGGRRRRRAGGGLDQERTQQHRAIGPLGHRGP
eukprot:8048755-Pyramimonas_sp.AAC.1